MLRGQPLDDVASAERGVLPLGRQVNVVSAPCELVNHRLEVAEVAVVKRGEQDSQRGPPCGG